MNSKIQKLKLEIKKAEEQELVDNLNKELKTLKKDFTGKCFSSHVLNRIGKSTYGWIVYYEKFFIENFKIYVREWQLSISRREKDGYISYTRHISNRILSGDEYSPSYNLYRGFSSFKHEITKERFLKIWNFGIVLEADLNQVFKETVSEPYQEEISIGDASNEETINRCLKETGIECIDITKFPSLLQVLQYKTIALFQNNRWIPKTYAKQLLEWQIKELKRSNVGVFSNARSIYYNEKHIATIKKFIEDEL